MLYIFAIILIFISSYILIIKDFKLSLYVLMVLSLLLHKELFSFYRWDLMPVRVFMLALLCSGITKTYLYVAKSGGIKSLIPFLKDPFILMLNLIWLVRGLSIVFSKNLQASLLLFGFFTTIVALGIYIYLTFRENPRELLKYLRFYIYLLFGLVLFGFYQLFFYYKNTRVIGAMWPVPGKIPRVGSLFWDVNHYGALLAALLPVLGGFILTGKNLKTRIFDIFIFLSFSASLLLTNSRTAWIIAGLSFLCFVTLFLIKKFGAKGILYIIIAITLISTPLAIEYSDKKSAFRKKVKDYFHYRIDSFDSHMMLLTGTYQIFETYPYLGGGYGSFFEHFSKTKIAPEFFTRDTAALSNRVPAHTIWGEALSETGVIGTSIYVLFSLFIFLTPLYVFFNNNDKEIFIMASVISSAIFGWFLAGIFYSYNAEFFWITTFIYFVWSVGIIGKEYIQKVIKFFFTKNEILLSAILLLSSFLIFINLGKNHLIPWDEAIYAKVAKNMVNTNEYVVPHWDNLSVGWFEKPPMYMWMMSGFMKMLGFISIAARLPSAIFGFLTVLLTYLIGKKFFNKTAALISSLALVTTVHFLYYSRAAMLDVTTTFFITLSLYLYWNAKSSKKTIFWILSGLSVGLSTMTKGVVGLLPFLVITFYEIYLFLIRDQKINKKILLNYLTIFSSFILVSLPWHFTMYKSFGNSFVNKYFLYHVWNRATSGIEEKGNTFFWYLLVLRVSMRLWFIALLGAFPFTLFSSFKKDKKFIFLSIWAISFFLFFSISKSKLVWYIIPIYPVLSLMIGNFIERFLSLIMKIRIFNNLTFKSLFIYFLILSSLFYLFLNRELVYTSDLNGPQARLLMLKDEVFGIEDEVYIDRMEISTPYFYTEGPFKIIDFIPDDSDRVPNVSVNKPLILLTKKGRYEKEVAGYKVISVIVKEDKDWVLWYVPPEFKDPATPIIEF